MSAIGRTTEPTGERDVLLRASERALLVPDLLVEARRVANTVIAGWHGRRKRGPGETFWQFRPWGEGESESRIDWRRSARDDQVYLRDREWEAAHTVWVWADPSPSMRFQSVGGTVPKEGRALVLALSVAEVLARSGERVGYAGLTRPIAARNAAERIALGLGRERPELDVAHLRGPAEVVILSDFLSPLAETLEVVSALAQRGIRGHLVEVCDPAEETFPYSGRVEFRDPETGERLMTGRADELGAEYRNAFLARRTELRRVATRAGWSHVVHRTDRPASEALVALHVRLSGSA